MRRRVLAVDIDGTLVNSRDELSPETQTALRRAQDAGVRIVLATGRRYSRVLHLVEPLGIDAPVVTAGGALIKRTSDHVTLHASLFDRKLLCQTVRLVAERGCDALLYGDTYAEGFDYYCPRLDVTEPALAEYLSLNPRCERLWPTLMTDPPPSIFAGFAMGSREQMLALQGHLHASLPNQLDLHVLRSPRYRGFMCEMAPSGVSKWSGICRLTDAWGIRAEEICAVGDDVNDIPMIRAAGLGVAMGNALPEVQAAADRVAPGHDDHGLVQVVEWILAGE